MTIKGLLFDKDGTLLDFQATWGQTFQDIAHFAAGGDARLGERLLRAGGAEPLTGTVAADSVLAAGNTAHIADTFRAAGSLIERATLIRALDERFIHTAVTAVPLTDLVGLFRRLRGRGLKLGIASSDNEAAIGATLTHLGLADLVDFVAGYDSGHGVKPEPGMVMAFCHATGLSAGEVAMIGDNQHDLMMGRAAGAGWVVGVLSGTGTLETLGPLADVCVAGVDGLEDLLNLDALEDLLDVPAGRHA